MGDYSTIEKAVTELYDLRDHDFSLGVAEKEAAITQKQQEILKQIDQVTGDTDNSSDYRQVPAHLAYLKGRALNIGSSYDDAAQRLLSTAVKKDPSLLPAWNALGDAFWKKKDFDNARNCFTSVLAKEPGNLDALCGISMVLRQVRTETADERKGNVEKSVQHAKEAVAKNMSSSSAWYVLGNSYLSSFFMLSHNTDDLKKAMNAYNFAEAKSKAAGYPVVSPDLLYNRATVYKFQERYQEALDGFRKAMQADPSLTQAMTDAEDVVKLVARVADLVENHGKLKPKKLKQLASALASKELLPDSPPGLVSTTLQGLVKGKNMGKVVNVKVVAVVSSVGAVPLICVAADKNGEFCAVSIYNVPSDALHLNDQLTVIDPEQTAITLNAGEQSWKYTALTVHEPMSVIRNRQHQMGEMFAESRLSLQTGT